jgi:hypothetical protein
VPGIPGVPSAEDLSALPAGELAARLAEAYRIIAELTAQVGRLSAQVEDLSSGGCWRTIEGLADFAMVQSYLSTAAKWGISRLDALRDLFHDHAWLPPGLEPAR